MKLKDDKRLENFKKHVALVDNISQKELNFLEELEIELITEFGSTEDTFQKIIKDYE